MLNKSLHKLMVAGLYALVKFVLSLAVGKASRSLGWWCFKPGIAMEEFSKLGVGSIILTSGSLSPLDSFAQELNL